MKYIKLFETVDEYRHKKIMQFSRDIQIHDLPHNLRVNNGVNSYMVALEQLKEYFDGTLSIEEISEPDNTLRNIMLLWHLDKNKCIKNILMKIINFMMVR